MSFPRTACALALLLATACTGTPAVEPPGARADLVIRDARIIDGSGSPPFRGTVVVRDGVIAKVERAGGAEGDSAHRVIDAEGKFLVPGLWDMHVHLAEDEEHPEALEALLRHGVTRVRDAGGHLETLRRWQGEIESGSRLGPRLVVSGPTLNGPGDDSYHLEVTTPQSAEEAVAGLAGDGVDAIKVHRLIDPALLPVVLDAAHRHDLPAFGHIPLGMDPVAACHSGIDGIEHLGSFLESIVSLAPDTASLPSAIGTLTSADSDGLVSCLAAEQVAVTPTLAIYRYLAGDDADARAMSERMIGALLPFVARLHAAGVRLLPGTDAPLGEAAVPWGSALIEELEIFAAAGIPPLDILRLATSEAADEAGLGDSVGRIAEGFAADLVLLRANPAERISNLREVELVIVRGRLIDSFD